MFYIYEWYIVETNHIFYVGKGTGLRYKVKKRNDSFNNTLNKYKCDVKIIEYFENEEDAFRAEKELISKYKKQGQCECNLDFGGNGGVSGIWTEEMKQQMSINNPMKAQKQKDRMSKNNPMKNKDIAKKVAAKLKRPIVINGIRYDGTVDAARILGVANNTVLNWCKRGYNTKGEPCRYFDEEQKEYIKKTTNSKAVLVNGIRFETVRKAAEYINTHSETVIRAIKANRKCKGFDVRYDNQQPSQVNP